MSSVNKISFEDEILKVFQIKLNDNFRGYILKNIESMHSDNVIFFTFLFTGRGNMNRKDFLKFFIDYIEVEDVVKYDNKYYHCVFEDVAIEESYPSDFTIEADCYYRTILRNIQ